MLQTIGNSARNPPDPQSCGNCHYCRGLPLACRRNPPGTIPEGTPAGLRIHAFWPPVDKSEWCGEWKPAQH
jgi:hypothetical protein